MRNTRFTRLICLFVALVCLVSSAVIGVGASANVTGATDKSIKDYMDVLNTISYEEYIKYYAPYFEGTVGVRMPEMVFSATDNATFVDNRGNTVTIKDGAWSLTTKAGQTYTSVEDAVNVGGLSKKDLIYLDTYDGVEALYTPHHGDVSWTLDLSAKGVTGAGLYAIELVYYPVLGKSTSVERQFSVNGEVPFSEARSLELVKIWTSTQDNEIGALTGTYVLKKKDSISAITAEADAAGILYTAGEGSITFIKPAVMTEKLSAFIEKYSLRFFSTDANGNELRPTVKQAPEWSSYTLRDSDGFYADDFGFVLDPIDGKIELSMESINEPMALSKIILKPYEKLQPYATYAEGVKAAVGTTVGGSTVKIEAENIHLSSTNVVYPIQDNSSALTSPTDVKRTMLNTVGAEKWETSGQWVEYQFSVDSSGWYDIFSRFKQSYLDGMYVSRSMRVFANDYTAESYAQTFGNVAGYYEGVPFAEAAALRYDYKTSWQVTPLSSGVDANGDGATDGYQMYFEKGVTYTIRLEVTIGSMSEQVRRIESILNALNDDYLTIIKLTGTTPDEYRDYKFSTLLPDTLMDMILQAEELKKVSNYLKSTANVSSTYSGTCDKLIELLERIARKESEIAKNLSTMKSYVGSLGTFLTDAKTQPLQLDYILIQPAGSEMPTAEANAWQSIWHEIRNFMQSFFRNYDSMGAMEEGTEDRRISVWVPYGRDQANVLRNLTTNSFTPSTGIAVDLKLIAGGTLLPSILAGMGPDVYMGLGDGEVINYAIRGALQEIENIEYDTVEEFEQAMYVNFNKAAMLVLGLADADDDMHYYGLPETQGFPMMFVRMDILAELGIEVPRTWDDIYNAQSKLASNNMEIGLANDYRIFLYQMGGDLYADDGMRINLDSTVGLNAFEKMCDMYTQYSFPYAYDAANRFRTGEMPIIISDYTALYNQLKVFATELDGCWTFVPMPGIKQEDGTINNLSISTASALVMIKGSDNIEDAWEYMKWETGADCQIQYANEMVAIIGDSAKHATANRVALESMPWTVDEYEQVSAQYENLASIPNYPGAYILGRYTGFAFLAAYNDGAAPANELLRYINTINSEITRKRGEFNLETLEIGQTLVDKRTEQLLDAFEQLTEKYDDEKYDAPITAAKYAVANAKVNQVQEVEQQFMNLLLADWDGSTKEITKASGAKVTVDSYYVNVNKQTAEKKDGGYDIASLGEQELVYFIAQCLQDIAEKLPTYGK